MYVLPAKLFLGGFLIIILAAHVWAMVNAGYFYVWWLDVALHFVGGFWLAALVILFFWGKHGQEFPQKQSIALLVVLAVTALGGVLWEFFEFGYDVLVAHPSHLPIAQINQADTMSDLFLDLVGGAVAHWFFLKNKKENG